MFRTRVSIPFRFKMNSHQIDSNHLLAPCNQIFRNDLFYSLMESNVVILLEDEIDRSHLALSLIKYYASQLRTTTFGTKNTIYIMTSVEELVNRARSIAVTTGMKVGCFTPDFEHDVLSKHAWDKHQEDFEILFMFPETYLQALRKGFLSADDANIVIFDDCNEIGFREEMFCIMTEFVNKIPDVKSPRVLAMTTHIESEARKAEFEEKYRAKVIVLESI